MRVGVPEEEPALRLLGLVLPQDGDQEGRHGDRALTTGLRLLEAQVLPDLFHAAADREGCGVEINVGPHQAGHLAAAGADREEHHERRVERLPLGGDLISLACSGASVFALVVLRTVGGSPTPSSGFRGSNCQRTAWIAPRRRYGG